MKPGAAFILCITFMVTGVIAGLSVTKTKVVTKEVPGPVQVVTDNADLHNVTAERDSLALRFKDAQATIQMQTNQLEEQILELQKARQRPEALPLATSACASGPPSMAAVPSVVPYQPRRRLFGRFR